MVWNFWKIISWSHNVGYGGHNPLYGSDSEFIMTENAYNNNRAQSAYVGHGVELEL